jgi:hypothetical protein
MDPVLSMTLRAALGLLFLVAAVHKLRDPAAFRVALAAYEIVPDGATAAVALVLPLIELATAAGLLIVPAVLPAALVAALLLGVYSAAIAVNLARGRRDLDCGCMGPAARQPIGAGLLVRNAVLVVAAFLCAAPAHVRPLAWLDAFTVVAAVAALAGLYSGVQRLMASAPGIAALRGEGA